MTIRHEALENLRTGARTLCQRLTDSAQSCIRRIDAFAGSSASAGAFADALSRYLNGVHGSCLQTLVRLSQELAGQADSYAAEYCTIDSRAGFVLPTAVMEQMKYAVRRQSDAAAECTDGIQGTLQSVSDLFSAGAFSPSDVAAATQGLCDEITKLQEEMYTCESLYEGRLQELLCSVQELRQRIGQMHLGIDLCIGTGLVLAANGDMDTGMFEELHFLSKLRDIGMDDQAILRMGRYGYRPSELLQLYTACESDQDREYYLYLTEGDYERAFAVDPVFLSASAGMFGADLGARVFAAEDRAELERFANAVLFQSDAAGWLQQPGVGSKTVRAGHLEKLLQGSLALLGLNSSMILQEAPSLNQKERNWDLLGMANLWNAQSHLEEELLYRRDPQYPVRISIGKVDWESRSMEYDYLYTVLSHDPFQNRREVGSITVTSDILETSEDLLNGMYLAERADLQEASDQLLKQILGSGIWDSGVGIASVAVPELGLALKMLETAAGKNMSVADDQLLHLSDGLGLVEHGPGSVLLTDAIDGLQAYLDKNTELSERIRQLDRMYEGSMWGTGIRSSYTVPDIFSSGEKTHIISGIYNPDYLETIGEWNRRGLSALLPEADMEQVNWVMREFPQYAGIGQEDLVYKMIHGFGEGNILDHPVQEIAEAKHTMEDIIRDVYDRGEYVYHWNMEDAF